jgi:phage shock protein C
MIAPRNLGWYRGIVTRVYRSEEDKKIAGLCSGIAEAYRVDANIVRLAFVFLGVATGVVPLLVAYVVGWIIIPVRPGDVPGAVPHRS